MNPPLQIRLLGDFLVSYGNVPLAAVNTPRLQSLLAYLVLHRSAPQSRNRLAFLLWPDSTESQAQTNLRKLLHQLRQAIPDVDSFLRSDSRTVQWQESDLFTLDVALFENAALRADRAEQEGAKERCRDALQEAASPCSGERHRQRLSNASSTKLHNNRHPASVTGAPEFTHHSHLPARTRRKAINHVEGSGAYRLASLRPALMAGRGARQSGAASSSTSPAAKSIISASGASNAGHAFSRTAMRQLQVSSGAALTSAFVEEATGSGDVCDTLVISATAAITEAGTYRLGGCLTTMGGQELGVSTELYTAAAGVQQLPLTFTGSGIGASGADGPYQLRDLAFTQVISDEVTLALLPLAYTTAAYSRNDGARGNAIQTGPATDQGIDTNANGLYDYLRVSIPVDVQSAGMYRLSLNLAASDGALISTSTDVVSIQDANLVRATFGKAYGDVDYDRRADLNGDGLVGILDFNLLRGNFGMGGAPPP